MRHHSTGFDRLFHTSFAMMRVMSLLPPMLESKQKTVARRAYVMLRMYVNCATPGARAPKRFPRP